MRVVRMADISKSEEQANLLRYLVAKERKEVKEK